MRAGHQHAYEQRQRRGEILRLRLARGEQQRSVAELPPSSAADDFWMIGLLPGPAELVFDPYTGRWRVDGGRDFVGYARGARRHWQSLPLRPEYATGFDGR